MDFQTHSVPADLAGSVRLIWTLRGAADVVPRPEMVAPDGCPELVVNWGDLVRQRTAAGVWVSQSRVLLVGQMTGPVAIAPTGQVDLVGIRLWPTAVPAAIGLPMADLRDRIEDARLVLRPVDRRSLATLIDRPNDDSPVDRVAPFLRRWLRPTDATPPPVAHAVRAIFDGRGAVRIDRLQAEVGTSTRHLERMFRTHVGLSPKELSWIVRAQHAIRLHRAHPSWSGARIAAASGYADQAHMIREVRRLSGVSPTRLPDDSTLASRLQTD